MICHHLNCVFASFNKTRGFAKGPSPMAALHKAVCGGPFKWVSWPCRAAAAASCPSPRAAGSSCRLRSGRRGAHVTSPHSDRGLHRVTGARRHLSPRTRQRLRTSPPPSQWGGEPRASRTRLRKWQTPATHFPREERNPGDPSGSLEESKDQPREKISPPPPLFSRGGRGSLAPFHPAFYFPLRGGEDFAMAVLAPSLPVPAPLELRHPPVQPTATASNWPFKQTRDSSDLR